MPASGWRDALIRTWREAGKDNLDLIASGVAFYFFLAVVPLLGALVLGYGLVADPATVVRHMQAITSVLPADAARLIGEQLQSIVTTAQGKKGLGLLVALLIALYGAMKGAGAIVTALNIVYEEEETRGFVKRTLLTFFMTVGMVLVGILALLAISAMGAVEALLPGRSELLHTVLKLASWIVAALAMSAGVAAVYRYAPDRDEARWRWLTPGSALATLALLLVSLGFGFYVANFGSYNATYGSLGAVVVLLTWLYLSAYVVLLGAELNSELEHQTAQDSTEGADQPMGRRGAKVADTVGETP